MAKKEAEAEAQDFDAWAADVEKRLKSLEQMAGVSHSAGDPTVDNDGKKIDGSDNKANDPAAPESDKKAGKV